MKQFLSILLAVMMVMSLALTAVYAEEETEVTLPFTDVKDGKWFTDAVKYVYANGLMNGKSDTQFAPNEVLTRAQFAKMLWSLAGSPATEADLKFADTKNTQWYAESLTWAVQSGIVNGYEEGGKSLFKPNKNIARDELAKMIVTFLQFMAHIYQLHLWKGFSIISVLQAIEGMVPLLCKVHSLHRRSGRAQ